MRVLVVGSGGREHALAWKVAASPRVTEVLVAPGNAGTARVAKCRNVALRDTDAAGLAALATSEGVVLAVIGPESALVAGVSDALRAAGVPTVGPGRDGARLEASKAWAKEIMAAAGVPTAAAGMVTSADEVARFFATPRGACVVKADGLAAGKGVVVCDSAAEARDVALTMLRDLPFGDASAQLVIEERLTGPELSYIVLTDGERFVPLPAARDHKRLGEGDTGPNTGGMGAFTPVPEFTTALEAELQRTVVAPTLGELRRRGVAFRGFLYCGLMLTPDGPRVLEFNTRLGDPEAQAILMSLTGDLVPALEQAAAGALTLDTLGPFVPAAVVVLAAAGYPTTGGAGEPILEGGSAATADGAQLFVAGATAAADGGLLATGGRVLGVCASAASAPEALARVYARVSGITWPGMRFRRDIGLSARG